MHCDARECGRPYLLFYALEKRLNLLFFPSSVSMSWLIFSQQFQTSAALQINSKLEVKSENKAPHLAESILRLSGHMRWCISFGLCVFTQGMQCISCLQKELNWLHQASPTLLPALQLLARVSQVRCVHRHRLLFIRQKQTMHKNEWECSVVSSYCRV